jgi:hypothetical protein
LDATHSSSSLQKNPSGTNGIHKYCETNINSKIHFLTPRARAESKGGKGIKKDKRKMQGWMDGGREGRKANKHVGCLFKVGTFL